MGRTGERAPGVLNILVGGKSLMIWGSVGKAGSHVVSGGQGLQRSQEACSRLPLSPEPLPSSLLCLLTPLLPSCFLVPTFFPHSLSGLPGARGPLPPDLTQARASGVPDPGFQALWLVTQHRQPQHTDVTESLMGQWSPGVRGALRSFPVPLSPKQAGHSQSKVLSCKTPKTH